MKKRKNRSELWHKNVMAFQEIIGNPYEWPEPVEGQYWLAKNKSTVIIAHPDKTVKVPINPAKPSVIDFAVDVEHAVSDGLEVYKDKYKETNNLEKLKEIFDFTYLFGEPLFNLQERSKLEQIIGNIFLKRSISPMAKYFNIIKR